MTAIIGSFPKSLIGDKTMKAPTKKMTLKKWEGSKSDEKIDKKMGYKEGSKKDMALDKKSVSAANKKKIKK